MPAGILRDILTCRVPRECLRAALALLGQIGADGLVAPELDFDVGVGGPGRPLLVLAVPARIRGGELLDEPGQLVQVEHAPVVGLGLLSTPTTGGGSC